MFKIFGISNTGYFLVCGNNIDANVSFAAGRFGNVVSDDSFHSVACFSFLSNILSICIATKRKNIGAGLGGAQPPFF